MLLQRSQGSADFVGDAVVQLGDFTLWDAVGWSERGESECYERSRVLTERKKSLKLREKNL